MTLLSNATLRPAHHDDVTAMAELANMAGEGLPLCLWTGMAADNQTGWDVGRERARREAGEFSYRNAVMLDDGTYTRAACLVGYMLADKPEPIPDDMPAIVRPLQELENLAPGTWYVNILAVYPAFRGRGFGSRLLEHADQIARLERVPGMSIIVADANDGARRLYERHGFRATDSRPMVKGEWQGAGNEWLLMTKSV